MLWWWRNSFHTSVKVAIGKISIYTQYFPAELNSGHWLKLEFQSMRKAVFLNFILKKIFERWFLFFQKIDHKHGFLMSFAFSLYEFWNHYEGPVEECGHSFDTKERLWTKGESKTPDTHDSNIKIETLLGWHVFTSPLENKFWHVFQEFWP